MTRGDRSCPSCGCEVDPEELRMYGECFECHREHRGIASPGDFCDTKREKEDPDAR